MASFRKLENGRWRVRIRRRGFPDLSRNFASKHEAERWAAEIESTVYRYGRLPYSGAKLTLGEALRRYRKEVTPRKKGWRQETRRVNKWMEHPWADRDMSTIKRSEIAAWRREAEREWAPSTVRNELTLISHIYTVAMSEWGLDLPENPARGVMRPKPRAGRERRLAHGEEEMLLEAASARGSHIDLVITFALETGMRRGEIAAVKPEWIHGQVVRLPDTKNSESRAVPLSRRARSVLPLQPQHGSPVFNMGPDRISHEFVATCKAAGIEDLRFHDLRHEATSRLFEKGLSMMEVASITGHKSLVMLNRYTHLSASSLASKLD